MFAGGYFSFCGDGVNPRSLGCSELSSLHSFSSTENWDFHPFSQAGKRETGSALCFTSRMKQSLMAHLTINRLGHEEERGLSDLANPGSVKPPYAWPPRSLKSQRCAQVPAWRKGFHQIHEVPVDHQVQLSRLSGTVFLENVAICPQMFSYVK